MGWQFDTLPCEDVRNEEIVDLFDPRPKGTWARYQKLLASNNHTIMVTKAHRTQASQKNKPEVDLSRLLVDWLPELFFEILMHLHPLDLYHLARTTKLFRSMVMSRRASWLWEESYTRNPILPPCPSDISYPWWTHLLFGPSMCLECNENIADNIDHFSRRRECSQCYWKRRKKVFQVIEAKTPAGQPHSNRIALPSEFPTHHAWVQHITDQYVVFLNEPPWDGRAEFCRVELGRLKSDPATKAVIDDNEACWSAGQKWQRSFIEGGIEGGIEGQEKLQNEAFSKMKRRLMQRGYAEVDVDEVLEGGLGHTAFNITPNKTALEYNPKKPCRVLRRSWPRVMPILEQATIAVEHERLLVQRRTLVRSRKKLIHDAFGTHQSSEVCTPDEQPLPSTFELLLYTPFTTLIHAPPNVLVDEQTAKEAVDTFVAKWPPRSIDELAEVFPLSPPADPSSTCRTVPDIIDSVALVLSCVGCVEASSKNSSEWCIGGWKAAMDHGVHTGSTLCKFEVSERGCVAALALLETLGLDVRTLPHELEKLDPEARCEVCPEGDTLSWDECIRHFMEMDSDEAHSVPVWEVLAKFGN